jgi:hypothetical protein
MIITFIGNCQTATLCFYFQQLLVNCHCQWILFGDGFKPALGEWIDKVKNIILDHKNLGIDTIKNSDIIIHQEIIEDKSLFCNTESLNMNKKESCILIKIPNIYLNYSQYNNSLENLKYRENINKVHIKVSNIFIKYKDRHLMNTISHPNTFMFLEVVDEICKILNIDSFSKSQRDMFLEDNNYMKLPD